MILGADGAGVLAIDGKTLRRSFDRAAGRSALHVLNRLRRGGAAGGRSGGGGEKGSEIIAARTLLGLLALNGMLVSGDALHCQGETARPRLVCQRGGKWLFALKANRPVQYAEAQAYFADPANRTHGEHTTTDGHNGGRIQ